MPRAGLPCMLHCAKMRARRAARNFLPARMPTTKLTARPGGVSFIRASAALRDVAAALYEEGRRRCSVAIARSAEGPLMTLRPVSLDDKYDLAQSRVLVTGYQALIRACLMQKERDRRAGLNTGGYRHRLSRLAARRPRPAVHARRPRISPPPTSSSSPASTRSSPPPRCGARSRPSCAARASSMACSACGTARARASTAPATCSATPISPAPSKHGGVLALMGDDHTAKSSTTAHQSEFHFVDVMMPILNPAGVQEIIDYALYGWAMSRFTGTWTALKCMHETVESTGVVDGSLDRIKIVMPADFAMPEGGLNIRLVDTILGQEARLHDYKRDAMLAFLRANKLNKIITSGGRNPKIGIITTGKAYLDVRQALDELGIDEVKCNDLGMRLFKIGCPWPIARQELARFRRRARPHHRGRGEALADRSAGARGALRHRQSAGLHRQEGRAGQLAVPGQGRARSQRRRHLHRRAAVALRRQRRTRRQRRAAESGAARAGRNRATSPSAFPISARAARTTPRRACRKAAAPMPASAATTCRSGWTARRSATRRWAARAPTGSARRRSPSATHVFQNLGDGTYNHSGYLAIRAAIASGVNMTYKILFNDAVAMTGGQANDGGLTVPQIARAGRRRRRQARRRRHRRAVEISARTPTGRAA